MHFYLFTSIVYWRMEMRYFACLSGKKDTSGEWQRQPHSWIVTHVSSPSQYSVHPKCRGTREEAPFSSVLRLLLSFLCDETDALAGSRYVTWIALVEDVDATRT
jgi:hypothetical protein